MKKFHLLFVLILCTLEIIRSQNISKENLLLDFEIFRKALVEAHPGLYRYNTKEHMDSVFAETAHGITSAMTQEQYYRLLAPVVSEIKCGHTKFHPDNNWTDNYFFNRDKLFPLKLAFIDKKAFIVDTYNPAISEIAPGAELTAINGTSVQVVVQQLMKGLYSDGNNTTFKFIELGKFFSALYANLIGPSNEFEISYVYEEHEYSRVVPSVSFQDIKNQEASSTHSSSWSFQVLKPETGLLTIPSFAAERNKAFRKFLKNTFHEISQSQVNSLIIDVRNNEGGEDIRGALLLSYLLDSPFRYYDRLETTTKKKYSFSEHAYTPKFYGLIRMMLTKTDSGTIVWKHHKNLKIQKPQKDHFEGNVYVLINGASFSVTSEFAAVAHYKKRAVFIGEETGGGYYGNNSGTFVIARLPNSRLNLGIPVLAYYSAVKDYPFHDRGVIPEHAVSPDIHDILKNNDPVMKFVLQLISNSNL